MPEIGTSGSMSEDGKRSVAEWPKLPRLSSTLPHFADSIGHLPRSEKFCKLNPSEKARDINKKKPTSCTASGTRQHRESTATERNKNSWRNPKQAPAWRARQNPWRSPGALLTCVGT